MTVTRKLAQPRDVALAREDVSSLVTWRPGPVDLSLVDAAWAVDDRFGLSRWDSLIVAAAPAERCTHLLSEDLQNGQTLDGPTVIHPLSPTRPSRCSWAEPGPVV